MVQDAKQGRQWVDRGWYLVLEFGHSNSDRYDAVVRHARRGPGYIALLDENRALVHRNLYQPDELRHFWKSFQRVRAWQSARLFACGDPVTGDEVVPAIECYLFVREHALCDGRWRDLPTFIGCPNIRIALHPELATAWFRHARRYGSIFRLDKEWLSERLEVGLARYRCCPLVRAERAWELLRRLPEEIVPRRDRRWRTERKPFFRHDWQVVSPASDDAYADFMRETLQAEAARR